MSRFPQRSTARSRTLARLTLLLVVAALATSYVPLEAQQLTKVTEVEGITEYRLDNGLRVLLFPDPSKPTATVNITYFVGSRHEAYGETGMAHLLEHLVFKGSPKHPDIPKELTERGALPNGTTWFDRTNYFETFQGTEANLEWALDLESDRMVNSFIAKEDLESEMTVVRNEMELGENSPFRILMQRTLSAAYLWHNYGNSTIGARADVESVPIDRLQAFYRKYYQPDNAMLVIAGKFDPDRALELVAEKFGPIPRPDRTGANTIFPTYTREPTQDGERSVTLRRVGDTRMVMAAYHVPPGSHAEFPAVSILAHVVGNEPAGRLHKALVETGRAADIGAFAWQLREAGPFIAYAEVRLQDSLEAAWEIMRQTLDALQQRTVTEEELQRARAALLRNIELTFNNSERIALGLSEWAAMGDWRLFFIHRDRLRDVTLDDVHRVVAAYLKPQNRTVGFFVPTKEPDRAEIPQAPDIADLVEGYTGGEAVAMGEAFEPTPENVESRTTRAKLPSGFQLALLPKENRGNTVVVSFRILFGTDASLMNRWAAGNLAGNMLMRGTQKRTRQEISDEIDRLKARVFVSGGVSSTSGQIETTRDNLAAVLRLVGEIVREPAFDPEEFRQLKEQQLASLESQKSEPGALGNIAFSRHLSPWPKGHARYTATLDERIGWIEQTTVQDAKRFYEEFYGTDRGHMAVVGDFDPAVVAEIVTDIFGMWRTPTPTDRIPDVYRDVESTRIVIETPDKANAVFFAGMNLPLSDAHPDYPALVLGNFMLGGGFLSSRLAVRLRQKDGLSYGVGSNLFAHPADQVGRFSAFAIYAPENAEKLEAAFKEELERALTEGFSDGEVAQAKTGYLDIQRTVRGRDMSLASELSQGLYFDRTLAWDAELERKIMALTPTQINDALRRHIDPAKITFVLAGDFANAEAEGR